MADLFDSPKQSISHAREEIKEAESLIIAFRSNHSCTKMIKIDPQTGEEVHSIACDRPHFAV